MMERTPAASNTSKGTTKAAPASASTEKLHAGKWTRVEEEYVEALMEEFSAGTLDLQEGTTLRSFLAQKLNCKPKRYVF